MDFLFEVQSWTVARTGTHMLDKLHTGKMCASICIYLMAFLRLLTAMSMEVPGGATYASLPSPGVPQHTRLRRQTSIFSSSTTSTPPANGGSSAVQGVTMTLQDFDTAVGFLVCLQHGRNTCELEIDDTLSYVVMEDVLQECGNSFSINCNDAEFKCLCKEETVSCRKSPNMRRPKPPKCQSFIIRICRYLKLNVCDGVSSSTSTTTTTTTTTTTMMTTTHATSPSSTVPSTSMTSAVSTPATDTRAIEMTTSSNGTRVSLNSNTGTFEDGNGRLLGGIIGGVAGGVVLTISFILLWSFCRRRMTKSSSGNVTSSDVKVKEDDRRALCDKHSDAASSEYHTYELPDVIGTLPPYATSADLTEPEVRSGDIDEYNRLGDHVKNHDGLTHMYDHLSKAKLKLKQKVINNEYNHAVVVGEVTVDDVRHQASRQETSDTIVAEGAEPPYNTIDKEDSGKGLDHKYFVLEKTQETPDTPPYSKLSFD
ncbi:uncharacterized protein [Haliotis asinina]|uniref:uncharacterized protein n=1 Tax=Haliotis asinina TaxID=109174 RepID=UPI003531D922